MKHRVKWGFGPAAGRASRPERAVTRRRTERENEVAAEQRKPKACPKCVPNVAQTCGVRSVPCTTGRALPRLASWRAAVRTRNRAAQDLGGFAALAGASCLLLGRLGRRGARVGLLRPGGLLTRPGLGRRNVGPVCGNVRLLGRRWRLGRGTGLGVRRFFWNADSDRNPNRRKNGDGGECGLQIGADGGR